MAKETVLSNLNLLTFKTQKGFQNHIGEIGEFDIAFTPDQSLKGTLLDFKWADHILNDVSWLRADTFSWHSGDVYVAAYNHLAEDIDGAIIEQETIGDITITYYRAEDGHKICLPGQEANLSALYEATGVAWYYILDTENKQFKLPRTKFGFTGLRDSVGGYVEAGLPNITGSFDNSAFSGANGKAKNVTGCFTVSNLGNSVYSGSGGGSSNSLGTVAIDASISSEAYGNSDTVQSPATQMYLYFYVGNFEQDAIEQIAGINAEMFNDLNAHKIIEAQFPTADNGYTWYRKYADGWVEQGGYVASDGNSDQHITLPVQMAHSTYNVDTKSKSSATSRPSDSNSANHNTVFYYSKIIFNQTETGFNIGSATEMSIVGTYWQVSGQWA